MEHHKIHVNLYTENVADTVECLHKQDDGGVGGQHTSFVVNPLTAVWTFILLIECSVLHSKLAT